MKTRFLALPLAAITVAPFASAQGVAYGTDAATDDDNHILDVTSGVSMGPLFTGQEMYGLADDDGNQLLYMSEEGNVFAWGYGTMATPAAVISPVDPTNSNSIRCEAMAFNAGTLFGVDEFGAAGQEGLYSFDLVTGDATPELIYGNVSLDIGGLDVDPATGLFYGSSDAAAARGITELDVPNQTETIISPYPGALSDIDGLAFNPNGTVYLIQDEPVPIDVYDVATATYTGTLPSAIPAAVVFSAGTWSDVLGGGGQIGTNYCTALPNSTGGTASISASGSSIAADNDFTLTAAGMPAQQFGIFLTSTDQASTPVASGTLCLGGNVIRFQGPGQILQADANGEFSLMIDLTAIPAGVPTPINAGDTYNFTAWYRDTNMMGNTANFTDGLEVTFN